MDFTAMTQTVFSTAIETPIGPLVLVQQGEGLVRVRWGAVLQDQSTELLDEAWVQVNDYFAGKRRQFDLPLNYKCKPYQKQICEQMLKIPYGETATYGDLAVATASSAQAVGNACAGNPFPVIVPCHRVLAAQGLGGYSGDGGIETKIALLKMESSVPWLI